jgi:methyl-galactoside transport system substrate-binding protein
MKKGRRYISLTALAAFLALLLSACGQAPKAGDIRIGVTVYDEYDTFISELMEDFMEDVAEVNAGELETPVSVVRYNAAQSQITQNEQVEQMISKGCSVICVNLVDRTDPSMIIEKAREADVPVIFFNRELVEEDLMSWNRLYYVGADAFESGRIQGRTAAAYIKEHPETDRNGDGVIQYVVLEGEAGHQDAIVRSETSVDALIEEGIQIEKLESAIANWNRAQARNRMEQMIETYGEGVELVLANNDDMALGAADACDSREIPEEERPAIIGIDGTKVGLEGVRNGKLIGTVYNDKEGQARAMLQLALAAATGEGMEDLPLTDGKYIRLPYSEITLDNISRLGEEAP